MRGLMEEEFRSHSQAAVSYGNLSRLIHRLTGEVRISAVSPQPKLSVRNPFHTGMQEGPC